MKRLAALWLGTLVVAGCATTVHDADARPEDLAQSPEGELGSARALAQYTRRVRPAHNVDIVATLWDPAVLVADASAGDGRRARGVDESPDDARERLDRWRDHYLQDQTSFTVVLELANRPGPPRKATTKPELAEAFVDPLVQPRSWSFTLDRGEQKGVHPQRIEVQAIDRFPTRAGGYHYRIAYAVHFEGELTDTARETGGSGVPVKLRVRPLLEDPTHSGLGRASGKRGFVLSWWVQPTVTPKQK